MAGRPDNVRDPASYRAMAGAVKSAEHNQGIRRISRSILGN